MHDSAAYAGLTGVQLPVETYDLGDGLTLSRTYAHMFAPFMMAFARPKSGQHHPGPWQAASGGIAFDIEVQLKMPPGIAGDEWFDTFNSLWWIVALIRFRSAHSTTCPVVSDTAFSEAATAEHKPQFVPMEVDPRRLQLRTHPSILLEEDLSWIRSSWRPAGRLMRHSDVFNSLFQAFDQSLFVPKPSLALLLLWGALESIFSPARSELKFRISANIAAFLETPGQNRLELQKRVGKLYDVRSAAAHTASSIDHNDLSATYDITKKVIYQIIGNGAVPTRKMLEDRLFGVNGDGV